MRSRFEVNTSLPVRAHDRAARAQLIRDVVRPPFAEAPVEFIDDEQVRFKFRSPSRIGQRELVLHPLALLHRLALLVPPPRQHQVRAFDVLASAATLRPKVVPVGRVAVEGSWFGAHKFEPAERVPYREAWAKLLARGDRSTTPGCAHQQPDPPRLQPAQPIDFLNAAGVSASRGSPYRSRCVPSRSNTQAMYA